MGQLVLLLLYLRNLHQVNPQGIECVLISENYMNYSLRFIVQTLKQGETFLLFHYQKLMKCMVDYEVQKGAKDFSETEGSWFEVERIQV